jgi:hypothetical protein
MIYQLSGSAALPTELLGAQFITLAGVHRILHLL